jgi:hypothetical protein
MVVCHWVIPSTQTTITTAMDPASRALAQALPAGVADTYANRSEYGHAPLSTVIHRDHGRRSREEHAESQQYLTRDEEKALVRFLLLKSSLGQPVRIKFVRSLSSVIYFPATYSFRPPHPKQPRSVESRLLPTTTIIFATEYT